MFFLGGAGRTISALKVCKNIYKEKQLPQPEINSPLYIFLKKGKKNILCKQLNKYLFDVNAFLAHYAH